MNNSLKSRLARRDVLVGPLVTLSSPDVAEIMAGVGFDYLWIETEHAPMDVARAQMMIQAVGGRCPCVVRVPENAEVWIKKALDVGCDGIVIPQVKSAAEAEAAVQCCLYPPVGQRSVGIGRAHGYGMTFQEHVATANDRLAIILQVEHVDAVRNVESILNTPGIDAALIGPYDLSGSMDLLGQVDHPRVVEAIHDVKRRCDAAGVPAGIFVADPQAANHYIADGFTLIALGMDALYLWQSARQALDQVQRGKRL